MRALFLKLAVCVLLFVGVQKDAMAQDEKLYDFVTLETPPNYPGGMVNFYKLIGNNIKYPEAAKKNNIEGIVFVSFIIEKDGSLSNVAVKRTLGYGTDEEAVRVLNLSEKWNPGFQNGKAVRVMYNIPIKFSNKK
jgi:protein TonB